MPQINDIRELAQQNARYVSNSPQDWMSYLDVAARLYRYSFTDALLIHAQRPDATACAELELWNQTMVRWWALLSAADLWRGGWMMAIRWKLIACVRMELQTPAASCMRRRTVQHGQWVTTELLPTFWIRRMAVP